jgi:soluble lytic murein transglycosylase-like protein
MKLLIHLVVALVVCWSSPSMASARVHAYIDAQGVLHYASKGSKAARTFRPQAGIAHRRGQALQDNAAVLQSLQEIIQAAAARHGVDPLLITAVIQTESQFDPRAVSAKGAQGLMQLMPDTARDLQVADPFDPRENITGGTRYLRSLLDRYNGDLELSLAAYNAGPGKVRDEVPNIPETKTYVSRVMGNYKGYLRRGDSHDS